LYDPSTNTFTANGAMTMPRSGYTAMLLNTGKVLITGPALRWLGPDCGWLVVSGPHRSDLRSSVRRVFPHRGHDHRPLPLRCNSPQRWHRAYERWYQPPSPCRHCGAVPSCGCEVPDAIVVACRRRKWRGRDPARGHLSGCIGSESGRTWRNGNHLLHRPHRRQRHSSPGVDRRANGGCLMVWQYARLRWTGSNQYPRSRRSSCR
jgi:hypothetical protein